MKISTVTAIILAIFLTSCKSVPLTDDRTDNIDHKENIETIETQEDIQETPAHELTPVYIEAIDKGKADPSKDTQTYYKIFIDKVAAAKTSSGLFFQRKKLELKLEPGRHLFYAERWHLDEQNRDMPEYRRSNNIWQMSEPVYIDVSETGELRILLGYDHSNRKFYLTVNGTQI